VLYARALVLHGRLDQAQDAFAKAVALVAQGRTPPGPWLVADWQPPDDLASRIWLEALRAPIAEPSARGLGPPPIAADRLGEIDAERLASAALGRRLAWTVVPAEELAVYDRLADLTALRRPSCQAHRAIPPFLVTLAEGWLALGEVTRALELLKSGEKAAITGRDPEVARLSAVSRLEVVRRMRLHGHERALRERMLQSKNPVEREAARRVEALVGSPASLPMDIPSDISILPVASPLAPIIPVRGAELVRRPREAVDDIFDSARPVLGPRRLAELFLDEGELLALREPLLGSRALGVAASLFEEAGTRPGGSSRQSLPCWPRRAATFR